MAIQNNFPNIRPTLNLNFALSKRVDPRITFVRSTTATYFDQDGILQTAAANQGRITFDPATLDCQGLLIEEQRTNSIRNNTMQGAVAGTPGTAPTNWTLQVAANGIDREIVGTGTENGITYIDVRFYGTATAAYTSFNIFEATNVVVASSGQTWTDSAYFKLQAGATTNITNFQLCMDEVTSGGVLTGRTTTAISPTSAALSTQRVVATRTFTDATTAFARTGFRFEVANGLAIDITLRIGLPQLEQGAFATSVIPTTTTALTRNADVASMTGTNFSSWYNQSEGSLLCEYNLPQTNGSVLWRLWEIDDASATQRMRCNGSTAWIYEYGSDGSAGPGNITIGTHKIVGAYKANDLATCLDGGTVGTDTSVTIVSTFNRLSIGGSILTANRYTNGYIRRIAYYPVRATNAQLQALTG